MICASRFAVAPTAAPTVVVVEVVTVTTGVVRINSLCVKVLVDIVVVTVLHAVSG